MLFDRLKDMTISHKLYELLAGWLISRDSKDEKEEQLSELFEDKFSYTIYPSKKARRSYTTFACRHRLDRATPEAVPLPRRIAFKVAAVLIPAIILTSGAYLLVDKAADTVEHNPAAMVSVTAGDERIKAEPDGTMVTLAENATHTLPDRSTVRLTKGSELHHAEDFDGKRRVELHGNAHFNVTKAKNENDHFTIHTDHFDIKVLGTDFYVHSPAGNTHSTIALYHGSVEVNAGGRTVLMKPTDHLRLDHTTNEISLTSIPYGQLRYEEMPGMVFNNVPVWDALKVLEKDYAIRFTIKGVPPREEDFIDGDLTTVRSLDELLAKVQKLSGRFTYEILDDEIKINTNQ